MKNNSFRKTISFYKTHLLGDILILGLSLLGGILAAYYDFLQLGSFFNETLLTFG